jgi:hypothetical protein
MRTKWDIPKARRPWSQVLLPSPWALENFVLERENFVLPLLVIQLRKQFWPLDWIGKCFIRLAVGEHADCHSKFQNCWSGEAKVEKGWKGIFSFFLIPKGLSVYRTVTHMFMSKVRKWNFTWSYNVAMPGLARDMGPCVKPNCCCVASGVRKTLPS